jgi:hypothetical protein
MNKEQRQKKFIEEHPEFTYESHLQYVSHPRTKKQLTGLSAYVEKWKQKYPERTHAHRRVFIALRNGTLKKKSCFCGSTKVEAHHDDYLKPLKVKWLCKFHHVEADKVRKYKEKYKYYKRQIRGLRYKDVKSFPQLFP